MFDKWKENAKYQEIKRHVQDNQVVYAIGSGVAIGAIGMLIFKSTPVNIESNIAPEIAPVFNNMPEISPVFAPVFNNTVNNVGRLHKIVKRINPDGTEDYWETIGEAAKAVADEYGLKPSSAQQLISRCINGHIPHVHGDPFKTVGTGTR